MKRTTLKLLLCGMALAWGTTTGAEAGDGLNAFRNAVRGVSAESEPDDDDDDHDDDDHHNDKHRHGHASHSHCDSSCDDCGSSISGTVYFLAFTSPWWLPAAMIGDNYAEPGYFAAHPYAMKDNSEHYNAYMIMGEQFPLPGYTWAGRVSGYYGDDFDSLSTVGGKLLLEHSSRWGIDSTLDFRHQDLGGGRSDELYTGDFNIVFRFAQSEVIQMRSGLGVNYLTDSHDTELGFNFTYGGDILLGDPFILSADLDLGTLGEASVTHFRTTIGAVFHGVEVYTGYDYYEVGDADISTLISGVRIWF